MIRRLPIRESRRWRLGGRLSRFLLRIPGTVPGVTLAVTVLTNTTAMRRITTSQRVGLVTTRGQMFWPKKLERRQAWLQPSQT